MPVHGFPYVMSQNRSMLEEYSSVCRSTTLAAPEGLADVAAGATAAGHGSCRSWMNVTSACSLGGTRVLM